MEYTIIAPDGSQGTAESAAGLRALQLDGRIQPGSHVIVTATGRQLSETELDGLLSGTGPVIDAPRRPLMQESVWPIVSVVLWSVGGLVWFFVFKGWGFIIAAFTLWDAIRLKAAGSKWGNLALLVAGIAALAIAWGWYDRISSGQAEKPPVQSPGS